VKPSWGRTTFVRIDYIEGGGPRTAVVVGGSGGKKRIMEIIRHVHPQWLIQDVVTIPRPKYAIKWSSTVKNKRR